MVVKLDYVVRAFKKVFSNWKYVLLAMLMALILFGVIIFLPVGRVSAKVFYYQVTGLDAVSLAIMIFFTMLAGTLVAMNVYLFKKTHTSKKKVSSRGVISLLSSFFASIFGSAVCVACLSILLGFLGLPTITFLVSYRREFFLVSVAIALISLYVASRAVVEHETCKTCRISIKKSRI